MQEHVVGLRAGVSESDLIVSMDRGQGSGGASQMEVGCLCRWNGAELDYNQDDARQTVVNWIDGTGWHLLRLRLPHQGHPAGGRQELRVLAPEGPERQAAGRHRLLPQARSHLHRQPRHRCVPAPSSFPPSLPHGYSDLAGVAGGVALGLSTQLAHS